MSTHKDLKDFIQNVYNFKKVWKEKCNKYDIDSQPFVLPAVERIVVLGDIHGDWDMLMKTLKVGNVINDDGDWIGGETVVVQVGDQVDRCRYSGVPCNKKGATEFDEGNDWKILQYMTKLHKQATKKGGAVYSLLGNHEIMNVEGDFRYVSYEGLREFDNYTYEDENGKKVTIKDGKEARAFAFKPGNEIAEFLACTRQVALIIGSNLFVHAGILPKIAKKYSVKNINQLMSLYLFDELKKPSKYKDLFNSQDYSPLWNRVFGNMGLQKYRKSVQSLDLEETKEKCSSLLDPLKEIYQVDKIFVGHTPLMEHGMGSVCNKKIWLTDYGSSKAFDKFDKSISESDFSGGSSDSEKPRSEFRKAQVLEIRNDGKEINILK
jgi:hypothetical protein